MKLLFLDKVLFLLQKSKHTTRHDFFTKKSRFYIKKRLFFCYGCR